MLTSSRLLESVLYILSLHKEFSFQASLAAFRHHDQSVCSQVMQTCLAQCKECSFYVQGRKLPWSQKPFTGVCFLHTNWNFKLWLIPLAVVERKQTPGVPYACIWHHSKVDFFKKNYIYYIMPLYTRKGEEKGGVEQQFTKSKMVCFNA